MTITFGGCCVRPGGLPASNAILERCSADSGIVGTMSQSCSTSSPSESEPTLDRSNA
jgi:hypothetical protein